VNALSVLSRSTTFTAQAHSHQTSESSIKSWVKEAYLYVSASKAVLCISRIT